MKKRDNEDLFPGQQKGLIRVFIQRDGQENTAQLHFHFFDEESDEN